MKSNFDYHSFDEYWNECGDVYAMEVAEKVWDYQQSKIDDLQDKLDASEKTRSTLYEENVDLRAKNDDLQKIVDAVKVLIEDLNKCYQQDHQNKFEYWCGFADSAGILGKRLEQVIRGGE